MLPRFLLLLLFVVALLTAAARYVHRRLGRVLGLGARGRRIVAVVFGAGIAVAVASRGLEGRVPSELLAWPGLAAYALVLGLLIASLLLGAFDLARLALHIARRAWARTSAGHKELAQPLAVRQQAAAATRREFVARASASTAMVVGAGLSAYGTFVGRNELALERVTIPMAGLSPRLDGYTIVQLSDVHLGVFVSNARLRQAERLVRAAAPDLLVLTGDMIDTDAREAERLTRFVHSLGGLARHGIVAIAGNHDYYAGIDQTLAALARGGATVLRNAGLLIGAPTEGFVLLGVDDLWARRSDPRSRGPDLEAAMAQVRGLEALPRILLCHNPAFFRHAAGRVALQLSGHTHGSQLNVGRTLTTLVIGHPWVSGLYSLGGSRLYVSRGFGTAGPPSRLGSPPEITRIVLTPADARG
jgi:uncharacterized protein